MPTTVDVREAKTHLSGLLQRVERGEEIVIARAGRPIARLSPVEPVERPLGFVEGRFDDTFWKPLPEDELPGSPRPARSTTHESLAMRGAHAILEPPGDATPTGTA